MPRTYTGPPADQWGLETFPTTEAGEGEGEGDPAIWIYLNFLKAYLQVDGNLLPLWNSQGIAPGRPVVNAIRAHNPSDKEAAAFAGGLASKDLPALYMWSKEAPDASTFEFYAEDWLVQSREWHLLWVPPPATTAARRRRGTLADTMAKAIATAIERGRTPGFVVPGDTDTTASWRGSYVHDFTSVYSINVTHSGPARVEISAIGDAANGESRTFVLPALEVRFEYRENLILDPRIWSVPAKLQQTVTLGNPIAVPWGPLALFATGDWVVATPPGVTSRYLFHAASVTGDGLSGTTAPVWPTTLNATVSDGSSGTVITWTCKGPVPPAYALVGNG